MLFRNHTRSLSIVIKAVLLPPLNTLLKNDGTGISTVGVMILFNILSAPENIKTIIRNIIHLLCHFLIDLTKIKKQASIANNKKILIK
jgi:hypothetical protein